MKIILDSTENEIEKLADMTDKSKVVSFTEIDFKDKGVQFFRRLKNKGILLMFDCSYAENSRAVIEGLKPNFIINPEVHKKKDYNHQPDSGLDLVIGKIMKEKDISYCMDSDALRKNINKYPHMLSRYKQNMLILKKNKCKINIIGSDRQIADYIMN